MKISKFRLVLIGAIASLSLASCSSGNANVIKEYSDFGKSVLDTDESDEDMTVVFFDNDNVVSEDGASYTRPKRQVSKTIGSSDCYMVKSGMVELLVDGGYQAITSYGSVTSSYAYNDDYVKNECQENLLKKIASVISEDGVLDYLIVTHADYDHIAALIATGGIFDAFLNKKTITKFDGSTVTFDKIKYIVDFDSGLVKNFSDEGLEKNSRLVRSDYYQAYVRQRDSLVERGTSYCPASALFDDEILAAQNYSFPIEERNAGMPDAIAKRLKGVPSDSDFQYILDENYDNEVEATKDREYKDQSILDSSVGGVQRIEDSNGTAKYYYSFQFNRGELRVLYNWHYDFIFHSSFNRDASDEETTQSTDSAGNLYDSQDANNISVCFQLVNGNFKFLSLGDLGGNGENGLLKYYQNTDIFSGTSLFKASHHGSTSNNENSVELFKWAKPSVVAVTGCAIYKDPLWKTMADDLVVSALVGRTKTAQKFFDNISSTYPDGSDHPFIMYTNINSYRNENGIPYFESAPFYGDIKVRYSGGQIHVSTSYCGPIKAYISQQKSSFEFSTRKGNEILSVQETDWFKEIGFRFGGNEK